jgi:hypothetical protein
MSRRLRGLIIGTSDDEEWLGEGMSILSAKVDRIEHNLYPLSQRVSVGRSPWVDVGHPRAGPQLLIWRILRFM